MTTGYIINREHDVLLGKAINTTTTIAVTNSSLMFTFAPFSGGNVGVTNTSITGLQFFGALSLTATWYPLYDNQCVAGSWTPTVAIIDVTPPCKIPIPDCAFACGALGVVALGANGTVDVELKT